MKKKLLLLLSVGFCFSAFAQSNMVPKQEDRTNSRFNKQDGLNFNFLGQQKPHFNPNAGNSNRAVTKTGFTGSRNAYGLIVTESNCLTANQQLNAVLFTHRISNEFVLPGDNSGFIQSTFSTNFGSSWDSIIQTNHSTYLCRYPSGSFFNPAGNTNINNAYATAVGPITEGSGWLGNFFSYAKLDSTQITPVYAMNADSGVVNQGFARIGTTGTDAMTVVTGGLYLDANGTTAAAQGYRGATLNYSRPDSAGVLVWSIDSIVPSFNQDATGTNRTYTVTNTAWNKAGNIGYVVFNGISSAASGSSAGYVPTVFKTTDGGATWGQLPLFDFSTLPAISATLTNTTGGGAPKAWFSMDKGYDVAVDENGNLHVFSTVVSGYSNNPDSLDYTYSYNVTSPVKTFYMFDTYTTASGWDAVLVDSLNTDNAKDFSPFTDDTGAQFEIDARLQMSRSDDGSKLFFFWLDSAADPNEQVENGKPNIFGKGYDVTNQKWTYTKQFTFDDQNYFLYISDITLQSGTNYKIPATVSLPVAWPNDGNLINPMRHYFVSGLEFDQADFVSVKNLNKDNGFEVTNNVPNPFSQQTTFSINLTENAPVTVSIVNMLGTTVATYDKGNMTSGSHTITIDATNLASGLYFYNVKAGNNSITQKMVVKK